MAGLLAWVERRFFWIVAAVLLALVALAAYTIISSLPPRQFTILTGREGAGYYRAAQEYRQVAAEYGFQLNIQTTSGSIETLEKLEAGEAGIGFVQGGITAGADPRILSTLAGVFYEPVWVFYQREFSGDQKLIHLYELEGGRVNLGEAGSGASYLTRQLLEANGINEGNTTFSELPADEAAEALTEGRLDAAMFVVAANSDTVRTLLRDPTLDLMDVQRAAAYRDRFPYLTTVVLPEGAIDLKEGLPAEDKHLIATAANLVVRNDFHPDLVRLMTIAAVETHEDGGLFERRFEFPNYEHTDLPIDREERAYLERIKSGESVLDNTLPFWAAALIDRYWLFLAPIGLLLLLLLARGTVVFDYYNRRKIARWYDVIRRIDVGAAKMNAAEVETSMAALEGIERQLQERVATSGRYQAEFHDLHSHIHLVEERLAKRREALRGSDTAAHAPTSA
jgi:TRAP transporter TAXI family solute receptor